ncbi:MAG: hypothetical protein L0241_19610 [Planctomycetia bacterium]|nr:hypothetical protein [Planctomycetia bacterium]
MGQAAQHGVGPGGDQFFVTHCMIADSVLNNPGYTVRAASTTEPAKLDAAFHYPPYELPIDMWKDSPAVSAAPRRLALTRLGRSAVWVVHSSYLEKDTVDRDRSYFSHLLLLPAANPADVLQSWGADGWVKNYAPGASKDLAVSARLPVGKLVNDTALTAFLGDSPSGPLDLSLTVSPKRLRGSKDERRELFARVIQALLLLAAEEDTDRRRLYVHAEPGLLALLLYGAVRLLPESVTEGLTFSTFEPYHRNIRDYKLADVVGTYLGTSEKGLDPDLATTRGFTLDTFSPARSSPELRGSIWEALPSGASDLIELAASGEWEFLDSVKRAIGPDANQLHRAGSAISRARALARVDRGEATLEELVAIQSDKAGAEELKSRADAIWLKIKAAALTRSEVRAAFRDLLNDRDRLKELWEEAVDAILNERFREWDARWTLIREVVKPDDAKKLLSKFLGREKNEEKLGRLPTDMRHKLRAACGDIGMIPPRALLVPIGLGELEPLLGARDPAAAGYTAFVLLADEQYNWLAHIPPASREQMRKRAREFLFSAPPAAVASYLNAARPFLDTDPAFLTTLFHPYSDNAAKLMDRLLAANTLEPGDWVKLCGEEIGLTRDEWGDFLLENDRLANLLVGLGGDGIGQSVWSGYLESLSLALISPELIEVDDDTEPDVIHEWERKVHSHLRHAADRLPKSGAKLVQALPEGGVSRLFAANNLLKWIEHPELAEKDGPDEVKNACETFGLERLDLLKTACKTGGFHELSLPAQLDQFAPLVELFKACFPVDNNFNTARHAATEIIKLASDCPKQARGVFQAHFVVSCVPDNHFANLLDDQRQIPFDPLAEALIRQRMAKPKKSAQPAPSRPVKELEPVPVEDGQFADEEEPEEGAEEVIHKKGAKAKPDSVKSKKPESKKPEADSPKAKGEKKDKKDRSEEKDKPSKMGMWIAILVVVVLASVGLLVVAISQLN